MKKSLLTLAASVVAASAFAQGTVNFQNIAGLGVAVGAPITNGVAGGRVPSGQAFLVQLYYGAGGTTDASALRSVDTAPIGFSAAGYFSGSSRTLDASVVGDCANGARPAAVQVRAWQASLGSTYESALAAANGGSAGVLGQSAVLQITTGNPCAMPPGTPANMAGLRGFVLTPVPEPSTIGLAGLGLAALAMLRRRK